MTIKNPTKKATAGLVLAGVLFGVTACKGGNENTAPVATALASTSATATASASAAPTVKATAKATLDAKGAQAVRDQFAARPLTGLDPAKVAVPAEMTRAFGKDANSAALAGMKFVAALDGMKSLQLRDHKVSAADDFTLDTSIAPLAEAAYYKVFKDGYHSATPSAVVPFLNNTGKDYALVVDGKRCTPRKGAGFEFNYSAPSLVMNTGTSPDSAAFGVRTAITVACTEGGVVVRTVDRSISMLPVEGQWKAVGDAATVRGVQALR